MFYNLFINLTIIRQTYFILSIFFYLFFSLYYILDTGYFFLNTVLIGELKLMHLFYRLLLAHVVADFPLQTSQIFKVKTNTEWGVLVHTLIVLIFSILFVFPYLEDPKVIIMLWLIFLSHTMIDKLKMEYSKKVKKESIKILLLDQALHIVIILVLTFNFTKSYFLSSPFNSVFFNYLIDIYNNDIFIISLIGYIASAFFIPILLLHIGEEGIPANPKN